MKKLIVIKKNEIFLVHLEIFCENHPPTRHIKYKVETFAHIDKSVIAYKLP